MANILVVDDEMGIRELLSEILSDAMSRYLKGMLTNEEVIEELLKIAREIVHGEKAGKSLNLNSEELL